MEPFEIYEKYCSLKAHFTTESYDFFKYKGKIRVRLDKFNNRKDKYFFTKLSKNISNKDIVPFFISNFIENDQEWIGNLVMNNEAEEVFTSWKKRTESLSYTFSQDMKKINDILYEKEEPFNNLFKIYNTHPLILRLLLRKEISLESFIIMNEILEFFGELNTKLKYDIVWAEVKKKCKKYRPFLTIDKKRYKRMMVDIFVNNP